MSKHIYSPVIDAIAEANKKQPEYQCYSCGKFLPGEQLEDRTWVDQGERFIEQVCTTCIRRGWDDWGRP